ncbi:SMP-30/gluconolactonase/LRE family protein [Granulicoccus phenolivorans]|uniref:SMP-30/gluconolactonase/LRE family protein n=1 Tax=Granulicoccus phenolivorans TaxID=266854 RepID=UPI00041483D0|nr:SMP-30/gluconolactonase/LRE family protein [Granulicoccus phenolivorans]
MKMRVVRSGLEFPEGPIVMPDGSVVLVEMRGERLTRIQPDGRAETIAQLPGGPNGAALGPDGMIYVCNNGGMSFTPHGTGWVPGPVDPTSYTGGRIERVDPETGRVELLHNHCGDVALRHPNDLVFDAAGGFWFTDTGKRMGRVFDLGVVYYARPDGGLVEAVYPIDKPNGIGLSADGGTLYVTETYTGRLLCFDLHAPGKIAIPAKADAAVGRVLTGLGGAQRCDGLAVEVNGNICVATLVTGAITVIAPDGQIVDVVPTGDPHTTNIAFGGPDLRTAYITLGGSGQLIEVEWPRPGLALTYC